jgi:protein phosphatase 1 regulatory subunit 7
LLERIGNRESRHSHRAGGALVGKEQDNRVEGCSPSLRIRVLLIDEEQNVSTLSNLKILSIQSNRLSSITGLSSLGNLEELYISHNALTEISGLENNLKLRVLDISNNEIAHLKNLAHLPQLEELWASSNRLSSFDEVEKELKDKEELNTVYFEGNPLQLNNPTLYRNKIRLALPQIKQIDASE